MDQTVSSTPVKVRVAACQQPLHEKLRSATLQQIRSFSADFVCLPEHYPLPKEVKDIRQAAELFEERKSYLQGLSAELSTTLVGGTLTERVPEGFYNTCYVFDRGKQIGWYRKVYPTEREQQAGVLQGTEFKVFELNGLRVGVLICADVLFERSFQELSPLRCDIVFIPTASPYRVSESISEKFARDQSIFVEGARKLRSPIIKTCGIGTTFGHRIQGRSLIATPEEVLMRAEPHQESSSLVLLTEITLRA